MLSNYLTTAIRNLMNSPLFSLINIVGLAVGLAATILIILFVRHETSFDGWIPNAENIVRLHSTYEFPGRSPFLSTRSGGLMAEALAEHFDEVESATHILYTSRSVIQEGEAFAETPAFVDDQFFDIFDIPFVTGSLETALPDANSVVLSQSSAQKYFGDASPVGHNLTICCFDGEMIDLTVTGVIRDLPANSHMALDIISLIDRARFANTPYLLEEWGSLNTFTYLKLKEGVTAAALESRLPEFTDTVLPMQSVDSTQKTSDSYILSLMPILDIHLDASEQAGDTGDIRPLGNRNAVMGFSFIAALVLAMAGINFVNLSTARASRRAKEVGLRKIMGAGRKQLMSQFLSEAMVLSIIALGLAVGIAELTIPFLNGLLNLNLVLSYFGAEGLLGWLLGIALVAGLAAGAYPALYLSRFRPADTVHSNQSSAGSGSKMRNALVILQFAVSVSLIAATITVVKQIDHVMGVELGFDQENKLILGGLGSAPARAQQEAFVQQLERLPGVIAAVRSSEVPTQNFENISGFTPTGVENPELHALNFFSVGYGFVELYEIDVVAGRSFSEDFGNDVIAYDDGGTTGTVLINEAAALRLGYATAEAAVGNTLRSTSFGAVGSEFTIVGVLSNMQFRSAKYGARPAVYLNRPFGFGTITLSFEGTTSEALMEQIQPVWTTMFPQRPIFPALLEDMVEQQYASELQLSRMFTVFASLAILISCLGLFGLSAFTAERRTKEIGIRKVLGAGVGDIVRLLTFEFSKPVVIANVIAWPLAAWFILNWIENFHYRIDQATIHLAVLAAALTALTIAWVTVSGHAWRAARANPILSLKCE